MRILGISAWYHDAAVALVEDGRVLAAAQEERFSRIKHDPAFPARALRWCLEQFPGELDAVVFYEKPLLKFERILRTAFDVAPGGFKAFGAAMPVWLREKLWIPLRIEEALRAEGHDIRGRLFFTTHHESHAASAFFPSPFQRAAILTLDGVGEWTSTAMGRGDGASMELLRELRFPHSLGLLYSAFTYYCGFRVNSGEYKLMGLAPYGEPCFKDLILRELLDLKDDGSFRLNLDHFGYLHGERMTNARFHHLFGGPPRAPEAPLTQRDCDLARSIQEVTTDIVLRMARELRRLTGEENLVMAGGVALNCVANGRLLREGVFKRLWVQPAAGDAGGALGAALALQHLHFGLPRNVDGSCDAMAGAFLGPEYGEAEIAAALADAGIDAPRLDATALRGRTVEALVDGHVVGWFQGRAEFGPRALGNRSILGDARNPRMQSVLNLKIKRRESFRPFAPIVLAERATDYFELSAESPYMLLTAPVRRERRLPLPDGAPGMLERLHHLRSDIPAVTHVDYSARVQTVHRDVHPALHALLSDFEARTGCAVLVNTSFNVRGEPPVCHPREALACFLATEMDCLALGPYFVDKKTLPPPLLAARPQLAFAPD